MTGKFPAHLMAIMIGVLGWELVGSGSVDTTICSVQGERNVSPYLGDYVTVQGVVFADLDQTPVKGFFIQSENCDTNPSSSDGIFVYTGESLELVAAGDLVRVTGWVNEYYGMTEISVFVQHVHVLSHGNSLPAANELEPPFESEASARYFESLEGMYVQLDEAIVVGPTDLYDRSWLVRADLGIQRVFPDGDPGSGAIICADDAGMFEIEPEVKVGDRVTGLRGALDYRFDTFCVEALVQPLVTEIVPEPGTGKFPLTQQGSFRNIASLNLGNLFDTVDDPLAEDDVLSAGQYQRKLSKLAQAIHAELGEPAFLAVQEAENAAVLGDLVDRDEIEAQYAVLLKEGPDRRGLDTGLLYRLDMTELLGYQDYQGCTSLIDGLGPDGNLDVIHPHNALSCDLDGDGDLDGNRLFSRPPLVVHASVCLPDCQAGSTTLILVINHWKSKAEDSLQTPYTLPRRVEQAVFVAGLVEQIRSAYPQKPLVLLGDLNDTPGSAPLEALVEAGMLDLVANHALEGRYSYIYQGVSQALDHIVLFPAPSLTAIEAGFIHFNADFPHSLSYEAGTPMRCSDHDAVIARFSPDGFQVYLPFVARQ